MKFEEFTATQNDNDRRIDKIIRKFIPKLNLSSVYKAIRRGDVRVNGKKVSSEQKIFSGDVIQISWFLLNLHKENEEVLKNEKDDFVFPYEIVFQNEHILIINKPYDKTVQGKADSINVDVQNFYEKTFKNSSLSFRTGPLHRLDRYTTGLLCFSLSLQGARFFTENIKNHLIKKTYIGIVQGELKTFQVWQDFSVKNKFSEKNGFFTVRTTNDFENLPLDAKKMITSANPLKYGSYNEKKITLVEYKIETGRTHQIRLQSSVHGYPLLGDTAYGAQKISHSKKIFLHAAHLEFPENNLKIPRIINCPPPFDVEKY